MRSWLFSVLVLIILSCKVKTTDIDSLQNENWSIDGFVKVDSLNPILQPIGESRFMCPVSKQTVNWEEKNVLNPSAVVKDGKVYLLYRAQDSLMTSRLGLAVSEDGLHFQRMKAPVFYPDIDSMQRYEWKGGVEDPRLVATEDGEYLLTYTSYDGKTARLCIAISKDLINWKKAGLAFKTDKYRDQWSKSGAIIVKQIGEKITATRINGKYWMYFGDTDIFMASSTDLISWKIEESEESSKMISVLHPRPGYFDSRLVEPGPYALLGDSGVLLIYNGSNAANFNDPDLPKFTYSAGQALFNKSAPYKLLKRTDSSFIKPDKSYEKIGEVNEVCFVEGMVFFKNKWFLYYGTADSKIAVAVKDIER